MTGIIVAFPKAEVGQKIKAILVRSGYHVVGVYTNGAQLVQEANHLQSGVVVCNYRLPDMMYREVKEYLPDGFKMLVITSREEWAQNGDGDVVSLSQPLKVHELLSTLEMVVCSLRRAKKKYRPPRKRSAQEQQIVQRAKSVLMNRNNMTEEEAHRYLQKTSMNQGLTFTETAQMILSMMDQ